MSISRQQAEETLAKLSPAARAAFDAGEVEVNPDILAEFIHLDLVKSTWDWSPVADAIEEVTTPREAVSVLVDTISREDFAGHIDTFASWADDDVLASYEIDAAAAKEVIFDAETDLRAAYDRALERLAALGEDADQIEAAA